MFNIDRRYGDYFETESFDFDTTEYDWSENVKIIPSLPNTPPPADTDSITQPVIIFETNGELEPIAIPPEDFIEPSTDDELELESPETPQFLNWLGQPLDKNINEYKPISTVLENLDFHAPPTPISRGLYNTRNTCFMNSVLQALMHCSSLTTLLDNIIKQSVKNTSIETPVLDALLQFYNAYKTTGDLNRAFTPEQFYNCVCNTKGFHIEYNRQEDAQEFLSELMNGLEEDFNKLNTVEELTPLDGDSDSGSSEDEWTEVGANSKPIETLHAGHEDLKNPIQALFGGKFKSILLKQNSKQPSITTEPFQQVPLDITNPEVNSVQEAFDEVFKPEVLKIDDQSATKNLELQRAPAVLVTHLKRFTFQATAMGYDFIKVRKPVTISHELILRCQDEDVVYEPFAVVYHHGTTVTSGHYTADVKTSNGWMRIDDHQVQKVGIQDVLGHARSDEESRSAYMVLYTLKTE